MRYRKGMLAGAMLALLPLLASTAANAQKQGGTLRIFHRDSPANMSIHEEGTISVVAPMMPIFNNLVVFNPHDSGFQHWDVGLIGTYSLNTLFNFPPRYGDFAVQGYLTYTDGFSNPLTFNRVLWGGVGLSFDY